MKIIGSVKFLNFFSLYDGEKEYRGYTLFFPSYYNGEKEWGVHSLSPAVRWGKECGVHSFSPAVRWGKRVWGTLFPKKNESMH